MSFVSGLKAQSTKISVGDTIPVFSLRDQDGKLFNLDDYVGKKILVIYFYPKDESPVCTKEACAFRDRYEQFVKAGAMVIGINAASTETHSAFAQHRSLPFILLSDPHNQTLKRFGVERNFLFTGRKTFVVDLKGRVAFIYDSFSNGEAHAEKALAFINASHSSGH